MVRVKICGLSNPFDTLVAVNAGADAIGLVFAPSPRLITEEKAKEIIAALPPFVSIAGVFVDETISEVNRLAQTLGLDVVQLHGSEPPEYCQQIRCKVIKAFRVQGGYLENLAPYQGKVKGFLLDTYVAGQAGGTGRTFDWSLAEAAKKFGPVILAGGLTPENVGNALKTIQPYGVDVSSGVETNGIKDPQKIRMFLDQVRRYNYAGNAR